MSECTRWCPSWNSSISAARLFSMPVNALAARAEKLGLLNCGQGEFRKDLIEKLLADLVHLAGLVSLYLCRQEGDHVLTEGVEVRPVLGVEANLDSGAKLAAGSAPSFSVGTSVTARPKKVVVLSRDALNAEASELSIRHIRSKRLSSARRSRFSSSHQARSLDARSRGTAPAG